MSNLNHELMRTANPGRPEPYYPVASVPGPLLPNYPVPTTGQDSGFLTALNDSQLGYLEKETRIKALTAVSVQQSAMAAEWLRFRQPYERNIRIDTWAESRERRWLFATGERLRVTTQISIW